MKKWSTKMLVESAIMLALAFILGRIKVYQGVNGGSVTAGSMIPIILFALRWGLGPGLITGMSYGILEFMFDGFIYSPLQVIIEYPLAFGSLGLAGVFSNELADLENISYIKLIISVFIAVSGRFICHLVAGVIFFKDSLPVNINPWISSAIYQSTYLVPEFILSTVILVLIWKPISEINR